MRICSIWSNAPRQELSRLEQMLIEAQQTAEEIYLNRTEPDTNA